MHQLIHSTADILTFSKRRTNMCLEHNPSSSAETHALCNQYLRITFSTINCAPETLPPILCHLSDGKTVCMHTGNAIYHNICKLLTDPEVEYGKVQAMPPHHTDVNQHHLCQVSGLQHSAAQHIRLWTLLPKKSRVSQWDWNPQPQVKACQIWYSDAGVQASGECLCGFGSEHAAHAWYSHCQQGKYRFLARSHDAYR